MCTAAWGKSGDGLWLCFNRDEQRTRSFAEEPRLHEGANGPVAYARDPDGGGTWLAVASTGFAVALLNAYPDGPGSEPTGQLSRGKLVRSLAESSSAEAALRELNHQDLTPYPAFYLLIFQPHAVRFDYWDRTTLRTLPMESAFWTTSSFDPEAVIAWRRDWWFRETNDRQVDPDEAAELLRQPNPAMAAYASTMDRDDARTVSQVQLQLNPRGFTYTYRAREPRGLGFDNPVILNWPV